MIKLNRTTEYGLIALRHINRKNKSDPAEVTSAREVADTYGLPFEILAKTLQRLKEHGLIGSAHGSRGGYTLNRSLEDVTLAEFLKLMEGPQSVVACVPVQSKAGGAGPRNMMKDAAEPATGIPTECGCAYEGKCEIRNVMRDLNDRVLTFLSGIRLADLAAFSTVAQEIISSESAVEMQAAGRNVEGERQGREEPGYAIQCSPTQREVSK